MILQQPVAREQMTKLLATGATDLLDGFVSNKTRRKFKARLAWDAKEDKVVFAFEPRPERKPAAKKAAARRQARRPAKPRLRQGQALRPPAARSRPSTPTAAEKTPARKVTAVRKAAAKTAAKDAPRKKAA